MSEVLKAPPEHPFAPPMQNPSIPLHPPAPLDHPLDTPGQPVSTLQAL